MTPFGKRLREMRRLKGVTLTEMAVALEVSPAYLSALEHGRRGRPILTSRPASPARLSIRGDRR